VLQCAAVYCSVLQCAECVAVFVQAAVCCSMLQCVAVVAVLLHLFVELGSLCETAVIDVQLDGLFQTIHRCMLQCVAVCCSALQRFAIYSY